MSAAVLCMGCGGTVAIPEGFGRSKIRCPECGVLCPVPVGTGDRSPPRPRPPTERDAPERPSPEPPAASPSPKLPRQAVTPAAALCCTACGLPVPGERSASGRCPECEASAVFAETPTQRQRRRRNLPIHPDDAPEPEPEPELDPVRGLRTGKILDDEEDGSPYAVGPGQEERRCPNCARELRAEDRVVCPGCDFDLVRNRKAVRVYPAVERSWISGVPVALRWQMFIGLDALMFGSAALGSALLDDWTTLMPLAFFCTPLLLFVLGTYFRVDLSRNSKGKVRLTKRWYVCFVPRSDRRLLLGDYEGVASGAINEGKFWEWVMIVGFLPLVVPAVLWWYFAIQKDLYFTALTRDHGFPDEMIYRGWSQARMREAEKLLREVAGLKH